MKQRYYIELFDCDNDYFAQSKWVDSICGVRRLYKKWKKFIRENFDYENFNQFLCIVMCAKFNEEDDYGDIEQFGYINPQNGEVIKRRD